MPWASQWQPVGFAQPSHQLSLVRGLLTFVLWNSIHCLLGLSSLACRCERQPLQRKEHNTWLLLQCLAFYLCLFLVTMVIPWCLLPGMYCSLVLCVKLVSGQCSHSLSLPAPPHRFAIWRLQGPLLLLLSSNSGQGMKFLFLPDSIKRNFRAEPW